MSPWLTGSANVTGRDAILERDRHELAQVHVPGLDQATLPITQPESVVHQPAMLLQSGRPFFIAFVAFAGSNSSGSKLPPTHSSSSSCRSFAGFWIASTKSG